MSEFVSVRKAVCAGPRRFYPSDKAELTAMLFEMFARVQPPGSSLPAFGLISPHAGYIYSGPIAAHGYKIPQAGNYHGVIIVAPSHFAAFPGASIFPGQAYETPLG